MTREYIETVTAPSQLRPQARMHGCRPTLKRLLIRKLITNMQYYILHVDI